MDDKIPSHGLVLYIWPGKWDIPSFEPLCLAAVLYLQLAIPNKFSVVETANPDSSPSGQLPYLVHNQVIVTSFPSILKYVSDLRSADHSRFPDANLDLHLTSAQKSQRTAWFAHAESKLGTLVAHDLFAVQKNWQNMTGPALASIYPVPQRYYVPQRIREDYYSRLSASEMMGTPFEVEEKPDEPFRKETIPRRRRGIKKDDTVLKAFEREKALAKAIAEFDIYKSLLSDKTYIFGEQPTSLDVVVAAHLLLLLKPPYPQPVLKSVLVESYPTLVAFSQRIYDLAFTTGTLDVRSASMSISLGGLLPTLPKGRNTKKPPSAEDVHFTRLRWGFFGLVAGAFTAYLAVIMRNVEIQWVEVEEGDSGAAGEGDREVPEEMKEEREPQTA